MMKWVAAVMWCMYDIIAYVLTAVGLVGLFWISGMAIKRFCEKLTYEEELPHEDQDRFREESNPVQPRVR